MKCFVAPRSPLSLVPASTFCHFCNSREKEKEREREREKERERERETEKGREREGKREGERERGARVAKKRRVFSGRKIDVRWFAQMFFFLDLECLLSNDTKGCSKRFSFVIYCFFHCASLPNFWASNLSQRVVKENINVKCYIYLAALTAVWALNVNGATLSIFAIVILARTAAAVAAETT
jgi:hypothetical protein